MRLSSVKLAGFKSFVDTTTVHFPSNLGAIVGPNGSGKSNIIDAVRWVMGESSAKYLRGESMADVIFNGSTGRKPVGQASIELIFDNTQGKLGGEFAAYQEISVKRLVTRDGQSNYFLNGQRCRKRDVTDLFLGTGLGPRSYAIIMQDTISRLIEAKPEELRIYLEEAAGISKYKERRRETELRMQHTRDNLARLTDLRDELDKQLNHLHRQAKAAEKYKEYKASQRLLKGKLLTQRLINLNLQAGHYTTTIQADETQFEALVASLRSIDALYEQLQDNQSDANEHYTREHEIYYQLNAQLARLEQIKHHQQERTAQLQQDLHTAKSAYENAAIELNADEDGLLDAINQVLTLEPALIEAQTYTNEQKNKVKTLEDQQQEWQLQWEQFSTQSAKNLQDAQVAQTKIQHLEHRESEINTRLAALSNEKAQLKPEQYDAIITEEQQAFELKQTTHANLLDKQTELEQEINQLVLSTRQIQTEINLAQAEIQKLNGRKASLEELQKAALGQSDQSMLQWLNQHQLNHKSRLAELIDVSAGYEKAVEIVLHGYLDAIIVENYQDYEQAVQEITNGHICLIDQTWPVLANPTTRATLADKVTGHTAIQALLAHVYIANNLQEAQSILPQLAAHESVITPKGEWLGQHWLRIFLEKNEQTGVLHRQQELKNIQEALSLQEDQVNILFSQLNSHQEDLQIQEQEKLQLQQLLRQDQQELAQLQAKLQIKQAEQLQISKRTDQIQQVIHEQEQTLAQVAEELIANKQVWQVSLQAAEADSEQRQLLQSAREVIKQNLDNEKQLLATQVQQLQQLTMDLNIVKTKQQSIEQAKLRALQIHQQSHQRVLEIEKALAELVEPIEEVQNELQQIVQQKLQQEAVVSEAKQALEVIDNQIKTINKERHAIEDNINHKRSAIENLRMQQQTAIVKQANIEEQLAELGVQPTEFEQQEIIDEQTLEQDLTELEQKIARLGAINLAAIEEYDSVAERKNYLDAQDADLVAALTTLENAIRKIDKETKDRFKETYDTVNGHFQTLFPKIFGGGSAYLELTGEDLLETGVSVMARPPGKKNSTIHLLSGGEKALTAMALVFSLFQLNPAPFCMLDEVDAPLDDANVGRYCSLVKEMSKNIQFIFISHNKLAIEMADHLIGVTMREPGVSRLVAVDVAEAVAMAES